MTYETSVAAKLGQEQTECRRKNSRSAHSERARWYAKRHSIAPTAGVRRRQAEDGVQSRSVAIEMRKGPRPVPGRQGVGGSNPPCSTPTWVRNWRSSRASASFGAFWPLNATT